MNKITLPTKPIIVSEKFIRVELGEECLFKRQPYIDPEMISEMAKQIDNEIEEN